MGSGCNRKLRVLCPCHPTSGERRGNHGRPRKRLRRRTVSQSEKNGERREGGKEEGTEERRGTGKEKTPQEVSAGRTYSGIILRES